MATETPNTENEQADRREASELPALLPCPFCGRTDLLGVEHHPDTGFLGIRCRACGCIGPAKLSESGEEAAAHWNARGAR